MVWRARTTPDRLLLATVSVVLAGLISGALGLQGLNGRAQALDRARAEAAHQAQLQIVRTKTVIADTAAAADVLRGTEVKPISAREFEYALEPAVTLLVVAARQPDDAPRLAVANRWLGRYVQQVDNARTLARAGQAAPAARSLRTASELLREEVLPPLVAAQDAGRERLARDQDAATRGAAYALLGALLALLVLAGVHARLTLRTRRIVNPGLAAGLVLLLASGLASLITVNASRDRASAAQHGPQRVADRLVEGRVAAFDARGQESLAVISGDVPGAEAGWQDATDVARAALLSAAVDVTPAVRADLETTTRLLATYAGTHDDLLTLARNGRDARVRQYTAAADGPAGAFADLDATSGALLARQVQAADDGWAAAGHRLRLTGLLALLAGLGAAGCGWAGLAARSREYR